jgi:hypothetical protein
MKTAVLGACLAIAVTVARKRTLFSCALSAGEFTFVAQ